MPLMNSYKVFREKIGFGSVSIILGHIFTLRHKTKCPLEASNQKMVVYIFVLEYFFRIACKVSCEKMDRKKLDPDWPEILHVALKNYSKTKMYSSIFWFEASKGHFVLWHNVKICPKIVITLPNPIFSLQTF